MIRAMFSKIDKIYHEFPGKFWILVGALFIDVIGGTLIHPFFALYFTQKFGVGMAQAGVLLGLFSACGLVGSTIGGALADKFGRKKLILFGLLFSAFSMILIGLVNSLAVMYPLAMFVGLLSSVGWPAHQAMVADMLPEDKRTEGFGILRVAVNLSWIIGPTIGGLLAARSYMLLFVLDAIISTITAGIIFLFIPETKPDSPPEKSSESVWQTIAGYRLVAYDRIFIAFLGVSILMLVVYQQLYNTLSVYLRDVHGVSTQGYGFLLSANACVVVLLQFWVTRTTKQYAPMLMMALGTAFYMVGFSMYGFVSVFPLFMFAMLLITIGEMIVVPTGQALAARFAPEDMRGRYMAAYSLSYAIPSVFGPWAAGLILDNYNPDWVWYLSGIICAIAVVGFYSLSLRVRTEPRFAPAPEEGEPATGGAA
jgi:MFS family permease